MPKRSDLHSILIIGAGPIVIGQACEFDYSGTQACKALKEEGYRVILVNSNPATIMTDPEMADATYIEPLNWQTLAKIIERERPDALLPTMGGQTALNCALDLARHGVLDKFQVELIGANQEAIAKAEDRELFIQAMNRIGLATPRSGLAHNLEEAKAVQQRIGYPCIIRPSFTLGGSGGGIAYNHEEFVEICQRGLDLSPTSELLIDESLIGWKEYELEVVRDKADNCIIVCSIENLDPMGVHTGDSITVAPAQTLTDKEYQLLRNAALAILREIGVDTGGSNVQFGVDPKTGRMVVIEMNPRVSRSSALASKATGFAIAKVAAKLAVGYTLDELSNEITGGAIPASFEPSIDYVVTKIPRFAFEKFPQTDTQLSTQMKSVGEVMAMGRTWQESLQKAIRGLEIDRSGLSPIIDSLTTETRAQLCHELQTPSPQRLWYLADAFRLGLSQAEIFQLSHIDPWYLAQIEELVQYAEQVKQLSLAQLDGQKLYQLKRKGFADSQLAGLLDVSEEQVRQHRQQLNIRPVYKRVDTCAAEFAATSAYLYSTYEEECEAKPSDRQKIMILGGGPNRIGQGIEFDYCCVQAAMAVREAGYEAIMVNSNPETVSTDYDISDRLYFEPVTLEDVLEIIQLEQPDGVIVQYGGQTPLKLAKALANAKVPIIGTISDAIDRAEDRQRFQQLVDKLGLKQPPNRLAHSADQGIELAAEIGYPLVVRPSYVLGGRAMEIVYNETELKRYMKEAVQVSFQAPVLLDRFLDHAIEVDMDVVSDGKQVVVGGIMQHIEQAGVHSGDSACAIPPFSLSSTIQDELRLQGEKLALELGVVGLMNIQFAIQGETVYLLEVNPRASRTVPFVSKAIGLSMAKIATHAMLGTSLAKQGFTQEIQPPGYFVKEAVFPFNKFPGVDPILGPEMRSTGETMGVGSSFAEAAGKAQLAAGVALPAKGQAFLSVRDSDKEGVINVAQQLLAIGFSLVATDGTAATLKAAGLAVTAVNKVLQGRPHIVDLIKSGEVHYIVNTTEGAQAIADSYTIRRTALQYKIAYTTTLAGALAAIQAMQYKQGIQVRKLQELHP